MLIFEAEVGQFYK